MPRLTIIMPARDAAANVQAAIESTLRAAPEDCELIVGDDASSDATVEVVERIADPRVRLVHNDQASGSGAVRHQLMMLSDSEFVANMDADDYSCPWRFRSSLAALSKADVVFGGAVRFGRSVRAPSLPLELRNDEVPISLVVHNPLFHSSMVARRSAIDVAGGYSNLRFAQDYDLWLRMAASGARMKRLALPLIGYRLSKHQTSQRADYINTLRGQVRLQRSYWENLNELAGRLRVPVPSGYSDKLSLALVARPLLLHLRPLARQYYSRLLRLDEQYCLPGPHPGVGDARCANVR